MILNKYCRTEYESYENFYNQLRIHVPENFNFGYDIMDELAAVKPASRALVWCNDRGDEKIITFGEMKTLSDKCANLLRARGIRKGDFVMTTLKRHWQYWVIAVALHKLGAVLVPATYQLTEKDMIYRVSAAD
ncbi:MAG: AMP-binding protein, partial [Clostridiales bacterium]|nr:AMP-binding protein [Clostridiales bacterium]